jgi:hypothetical protein
MSNNDKQVILHNNLLFIDFQLPIANHKSNEKIEIQFSK